MKIHKLRVAIPWDHEPRHLEIGLYILADKISLSALRGTAVHSRRAALSIPRIVRSRL